MAQLVLTVQNTSQALSPLSVNTLISNTTCAAAGVVQYPLSPFHFSSITLIFSDIKKGPNHKQHSQRVPAIGFHCDGRRAIHFRYIVNRFQWFLLQFGRDLEYALLFSFSFSFSCFCFHLLNLLALTLF